MSKTPLHTVKETGAVAGDVLVGIHRSSNSGLLLVIEKDQVAGRGGRIFGSFEILHPGMGRYVGGIRKVLETETSFENANEFISAVSKQDSCRDCTHILNANALWKLDAGTILDKLLGNESDVTVTIEAKRCDVCGRTYDHTMNFCLDDGSFLSSSDEYVLEDAETVVLKARKTRGARANSREFMRKNFPDLAGYPTRTSRRYESTEKPHYLDDWWVVIKLSEIEPHEFFIVAGALDHSNIEFKILKIPTAYLFSNLNRIDVNKDGIVNLYIHFDDLVDIRHEARLPFGQFAVN
jgi:hypothetical protein